MTSRKRSVLIFSASYGAGHNQVSESLKKSLLALGAEDVRIIDLFQEAHPLINRIIQKVYMSSFSYGGSFYGWLYDITNRPMKSDNLAAWFNLYGYRKLDQLIKSISPDIVVTTFPLSVVPLYKKKKQADFTICSVMTDFCLHHRWLAPEISKYFVATDALGSSLKAAGVPAEKISATGIPIREDFERTGSSHPKNSGPPRLLIMAGAYGVVKELEETIESLFNQTPEWQITVVCGHNRRLEADLAEKYAQMTTAGRLEVIGYTENIHEKMQKADLLLTKPGGITLSEAISQTLPVLIVKPAPGQERDNARFFAESGAGRICDSVEAITRTVKTLTDPSKRRTMAEKAAGLKKPMASDQAACEIMKMTN